MSCKSDLYLQVACCHLTATAQNHARNLSTRSYFILRVRDLLGILSWFALSFSGCVVSISPVISEFETRFDPRLLGSWIELDGSDRAIISPSTDDAYTIDYVSSEKISRFKAKLGQLGRFLVLDVWPAAPHGDKAHPELTGADLILTYATNTFEFAEHLSDSLIYYPRFVRLNRCR